MKLTKIHLLLALYWGPPHRRRQLDGGPGEGHPHVEVVSDLVVVQTLGTHKKTSALASHRKHEQDISKQHNI